MNVVFDIEEDTKIRQEARWIGDLQHFSKAKSRGIRDLNVISFWEPAPSHLKGEVAILQLGQCSDHSERVWKPKLSYRLIWNCIEINALYGDLKFLDIPVRKMRNETI